VLRAPELDVGLPGGLSPERRRGAQYPPAGHAALDAAQDMGGLLGCERTLVAHVQLFIHQYLQVLGRGALNPLVPQPVLVAGVVLTQV